ncbi:MAG: hypothetical protein KAI02_05970 [Gammaproteobacteria bacterium]|nr:hypothetical protein [Gammaproteobacteria bacterium]
MTLVIGVVVALVVVFLLAYITIRKPAFGEIVIALAILMILAAVFFYFQKDNRIERKKELIPLNQIELTQVSYTLAYGHYYKLSGQLSNQSKKYRLQSIMLKVSFFNCPTAKTTDFKQCQLMSAKNHSIKTRLAPQQSTAVEGYFLLDNKEISVLNSASTQFVIRKIDLLSGTAR